MSILEAALYVVQDETAEDGHHAWGLLGQIVEAVARYRSARNKFCRKLSEF